MVLQQAAYGHRIIGIEDRRGLALRGAEVWPLLTVITQFAPDAGRRTFEVGYDRASIDTPTARLVLEREAMRLTVLARRHLPQADLVHPCLWPAAAVFARWRGLETLHAGAFVDDEGKAWAVLGDQAAGKTSLLAALALAGRDVLADDLLVLDGRDCFAGPRCLDLRPDAAAELGLVGLPSVRSTHRRRLALAPCGARFPLRGCVYLAWGDDLAAEPLMPGEHLGMLMSQRRIAGLGANIPLLLDLAGLPALRLHRPQIRPTIRESRDALLEIVRGPHSYFSPPPRASARA